MYLWAGTPVPTEALAQEGVYTHLLKEELELWLVQGNRRPSAGQGPQRKSVFLGLVKRNQINLELDLVPFNQL